MPSPLGHSLLGLTAANMVCKNYLYSVLGWFCFVVFCANAADMDFLVGWIMGDINRYHHGISHSIGMAIMFASVCWFGCYVLRAKNMISAQIYTSRKVFIIALLVYLSHLFGDYFGKDVVEPFGSPFLWPLSCVYYLSPVTIFNPVEHGNVGELSGTVFDKIFSIENVVAASIELVIILPFWLMTLWISKRN